MTGMYDVLVLGSGPAGFYSALTCSEKGLKTALIEKSDFGGTGLATGCLPVKILLDSIRCAGSSFSDPKPGSDKFKDHAICVEKLLRKRLIESGTEVYLSDGRFLNGNEYEINSGLLRADKIIIATGTEPSCMEGVEFSRNIISHKEAVSLDKIPDSLIVVGGDVEGIEFASLFSQLGTKVTVVEQLPEILPGYDRDLSAPVEKELSAKGTVIECASRVLSIQDKNTSAAVITEKETFEAEKVLITGFRKSSIPDGLPELGVKVKNGFITVDKNLESSVSGIFAAGDINGILGMSGAAIQQAVQLSDYLSDGRELSIDYSILPRAVFSIPQICGGGLQEKDIQKERDNYVIKIFPLFNNWRSMYKKNRDEIVKIICNKSGIIRGIWFAGRSVEYHGSAVPFILENKMTIDEVRRKLFIHPTEFESIFEAGLL